MPPDPLDRSPFAALTPPDEMMRDINRRTDLAEPTVDELEAAEAAMMGNLPEGEISPALDGALPSPDASFEPVTDADLEAARQSLNDYIENEIARQAEFTVPTPRQERANLTGIEYDIVRDALREVPTTLPPEARTVMLADRLTPASMWDERMTPLDFLPSLAEAAPFVDPDMQFASEFMGAIEPTFDEIIAEASPPVAEPPSDPAQLRELMQINPSNVIPGSPEKNIIDKLGPRVFDAALGIAFPPLGLANTVSGIFGGPTIGRFIGDRMIPSNDPRHFEAMMNLPQFSTDTSYASGDDDVFVSSRGGGDRAPASPPPAPEPVRRGALSDLRRRYLGAGDDLRRYGMGPERVYYDEEPVEMAEGGYVDPFSLDDPLLDAGAYINDAAQARRGEREARAAAFYDRLGDTWPAQAARAAYDAFTLPGDVYAGRVDPMSDEGIGRAAELGGLVTLGAAAAPAPRGALTMGAARRPQFTPQEEAFRQYVSRLTFKTEDEARRELSRLLARRNAPDRNHQALFGVPDPLPDDLVDRLIARRGGGYGVTQAGTQAKRPAFVASDEPIGRAPDARWGGQDTQDYRKDARPGERVTEAFVALDGLPKARLAGGKTGYDWGELERGGAIPPITVRRNSNGSVSIIDGNHRIQWFRDQGYDSIPAYVIEPAQGSR